MITTITLKNKATYNSTGVTIDDLTKLNYFFGNNGCGKSTLANYMQSISENTSSSIYPDCSVDGYNPAQEEIIVFNQHFIENNFMNSDTLKGVFSLNQTNVTIDTQIKANEKSISGKNDEQKQLEDENDKIDIKRENNRNDLAANCFSKRDTFKTFSKIKLEYSGNKKSNLSHIESLLKQGNSQIKTLDELTKLYTKLYEDKLEEIGLSLDIKLVDELITIQDELNVLLEEIIVGKDDVKLAELIKKYNLKPWVLQGKQYLEKTGRVCPFCQQSISDDFISQLNDMFDESSKQKVNKIEVEKSNYKNKFSELLENLNTVVEKYNENNVVSNLQIQLKSILDENINVIEEKTKAPNERKTIKLIENSVKEIMEKINIAIKQNDDIVNSIDEQKKSFLSNIWIYLANECKSDIEKYNEDDKKDLEKLSQNKLKIEQIKEEVEQLIQQNSELRMQTVNTKEAVDNINQILKNSGFMGFEILEKDKVNNISQYYLARIGAMPEENIFNSLSEGEKNFISFLYFYQLCLGTTDILANSSKKKIIVIDDPVSSMDSQVLFIVSTLVQRLIAWKVNNRNDFDNPSIAQVFIFTHNLYFYKEISLKCRPICKLKNHYRIFKNEENISIIESKGKEYEAIDDYSLMWNTLKEIKSQIQEDNKSQNILIANLFRRILESYANFIGMGHDSWATVLTDDKTSIEYYLKCAFISMINDESHKITPFDSFYFQKNHNETPGKLFDVFESIFNTINKDHYEKMMKE